MRYFLLLFFSFFLITACGNDPKATSTDTDKTMDDLAEDEEFRDAHELPGAIEFVPKGTMIKIPVAGGEAANAYLLKADENPDNKFLIVLHEWWGMNDYVRAEAERFYAALDNTTVIALDMYDGQVATTPEQAKEYMQGLEEDRANAIVSGALAYAGPEARIGTLGWCFGGYWSLKTSIAAGANGKACVMYYGMPVKTAAELAPLQAPILGIFATKDGWINEEVIGKFEELTAATKKELTVKWFEAEHAFANPTRDIYKQEAAEEANELSIEFLKKHL